MSYISEKLFVEEEVGSVEEVTHSIFILYFVSMCTILYVYRLNVGVGVGKGGG